MSTKTTFKRIALVAVAALGLGMVSVMPANAASITDMTIFRISPASDSSLLVFSTGTTANARTYSVFTKNDSISVTDLGGVMVGQPAAAPERVINLALGTVASLTTTAPTAALTATATGGTTAAAFVAGSSLTALTATTTGTVYTAFANAVGAGTALTTALTIQSTVPTAVITVYKTVSTSSIAVTSAISSPLAPVVGLNGQAGKFTVTYKTPAATDAVNSSFRISSAPAGSKLLTNPLNHYFTAAGTKTLLSSSTMQLGSAFFSGMTSTTDAVAAAGITNATSSLKVETDFFFWPDVAGTYSFTFFDDRNNNGLVDGSDVSQLYSITMGAAASTVTVSNLTGLAPTSATNPNASEYGAVIRIKTTDAGGTATAPAADAGLTVTLSGSAKVAFKNGTATALSSTLTLGSADFDASGNAYLNIIDAVAEISTVTVGGTGSLASATPAATTAQFVAASAGLQLVVGSAGTAGTSGVGFVGASATSFSIPGASTITWESTVLASASTATVPKYGAIQVTDTARNLGSPMALNYDSAAATDLLGNADFAIATTKVTAGTAYQLIGQTTAGSATAQITVAVALPVITSTTVAFTPASGVRSALLGSNTVSAKVVNQFGGVVPNSTITWSVSGRNTSTTSPVVVTGSTGLASFTVTDAALATSTATSDTVTAAVSYTDAAGTTTTTSGSWVINYSTVGIKTVAMTTDNTTAGVANLGTPVSAGIIQAGLTGPSAAAGRKAVSATATDANGAVVSGLACVWTVAGTTAAIPSTAVTSYTNSLGVCSSSVYAWIAGTYTVTVTAGGVAGTGTQTFHNATPSSVRTISATVDGNIVTAVVKDRFGNGVAGVTVYASTTGGANIGGMLIASTPVTNLTGSVSWVVTGSGSVKVSTIDPAGTGLAPDQSTAAAGFHLGNVVTPVVFTATTVGTTTTAETGVGATFSPAGVSSVTATVAADTTTNDVAQAAADAAAEATDAANAATDAANAAAEAADAATAAAQDAADAVAALSTQVAEQINALKMQNDALRKQLVAITNLIIKIQKKVKA
jgi:hypothetical protein